MPIRAIAPADRGRLLEIVTAVGNFTPAEVETAMEVIDEGLAGSGRGDYYLNVLEDDGRVVGYECHGPTPLTDGTYDLYWIAVDPTSQGGGRGRALLAHAEEDVRRRRGRLLLIETSSQESYNATKRFYERSGYPLVARIPDFYRLGDDKLIYAKYLSPA
ncbi:MAG TPA: GNAT family N-acetyltransferase [Thermoanaerobaculia bacterium]|jgi:ribosomal protein S18 acetylase RimI-like enzyme